MNTKQQSNALYYEHEFAPYPQRPKATFVRYPLEPANPDHVSALQTLQVQFDAAFPPIKTDSQNMLIISWAEIERQFLDLCAPWDQQSAYQLLQSARRDAPHESTEKTLRQLFVLNNIRTNVDTPEPDWGTGDDLPMP